MQNKSFRKVENVHLRKHDPEPPSNTTEERANEELKLLKQNIGALQSRLYSAGTHSALIVLQGMDGSGKDGTIGQVFSEVNSLGCRVESFKAPTTTELSHDFLWRIHHCCPALGILGIFNRSHYEDVIVARVRSLVPKSVWKSRFLQINHFEKILAENNTIILKFFLNISKKEQKFRLEQRELDSAKSWKLNKGDWEDRAYWDDYLDAYNDALEKCDTKCAPWFVIPSNKKWYRNWAIAKIVASTLGCKNEEWSKKLKEEGITRRAAIAEYRANS